MAPQTKIGARPSGADATAADGASAKGGKKKLIMIGGGAVLVIVLVAAFWFLAGPGKAAGAAADPGATPSPTASPEPEYELGEVQILESISINLQGGHYLRLGLGLQLVAGGGGHGGGTGVVDTAKALDAAIALYSGHTTEELSDPVIREELKAELGETLKELYDHEVVAVYYTDFVTQ